MILRKYVTWGTVNCLNHWPPIPTPSATENQQDEPGISGTVLVKGGSSCLLPSSMRLASSRQAGQRESGLEGMAEASLSRHARFKIWLSTLPIQL